MSDDQKSLFSRVWSRELACSSAVLHVVGCATIGTPESLDMPPDFYFIEGDRTVPHPNEYTWDTQRNLLYVDTFRRELTRRLAGISLWFCLLVFVLGLVGQGLSYGTQAIYAKGEQIVNRLIRSGPVPVAEMSQDEAKERLVYLRQQYKILLSKPMNPESTQQSTEMVKEANEILEKFPSLRFAREGDAQ